MTTAQKTSSLKQDLKSGFSSRGYFSFKKPEKAQPKTDPLSEVGAVAQVLPQTLNQIVTPAPTAPTIATSKVSQKETLISANTTQELGADLGGGVQGVEQEKIPEIPPEVESFLKHAEDQTNKLPEEIVIADNQEISKVTHYPKTPVLILPITKEEEKMGKKKSPKLSLRWLVEWSYKMIKKFSGKVIYRIEE